MNNYNFVISANSIKIVRRKKRLALQETDSYSGTFCGFTTYCHQLLWMPFCRPATRGK